MKKRARQCFVFTLILLLSSMAVVSGQSGRKSPDEPQKPVTEPQRRGKTPSTDEQPASTSPSPSSSTPRQNPTQPQTAPQSGDDSSTIKIDTTLVSIPVSVLDRDGKYVPNLTKRDFQLYEDGVEQEITDFGPVEVPFHVVLMLDTSRSTAFKLEDIQRAAISFVEQLRPDDKVMVISFDDRVYVDSEFTSDRNRLRRAISGTRTGGGTKLYDAVDLVISERLDQVDGRKAIVLFTDGVDSTSKFAKAVTTLDQVEESGVLAYPIRYSTMDTLGRMPNGRGGQGPIMIPWPSPPPQRRWPAVPQNWPQQPSRGGGAGGPEAYRRGEQYLRDLAQRSGGRIYEADTLQNLDSAFANIADELRHQYALSYYPTNAARDGSYRRIRVRVTRPYLAVRAREGYRANDDRAPSSVDAGQRKERPAIGRDRP
jgi:Ca-activated chloride channel homolog